MTFVSKRQTFDSFIKMDYLYDHIKLFSVYYNENHVYKKISWLFPKIYDLSQILIVGFFYMKLGMMVRVLITYIRDEIKKKTVWSGKMNNLIL